MAIQHVGMIIDAGGLDGSEKLLLIAYANRTDAHGYCWPGMQRLADDCGTSLKTVKRIKNRLIEKNLIKVERRSSVKGSRPLTDLARLNLSLLADMKRSPREYDDNLVDRITFDNDTEPQVKSRGQNDPGVGDKMTPDRGQNVPVSGGQNDPLTVIEPSVQPPPQPSGSAGETPAGSDTNQKTSGGGVASPEKQEPAPSPSPSRLPSTDLAKAWYSLLPPVIRDRVAMDSKNIQQQMVGQVQALVDKGWTLDKIADRAPWSRIDGGTKVPAAILRNALEGLNSIPTTKTSSYDGKAANGLLKASTVALNEVGRAYSADKLNDHEYQTACRNIKQAATIDELTATLEVFNTVMIQKETN